VWAKAAAGNHLSLPATAFAKVEYRLLKVQSPPAPVVGSPCMDLTKLNFHALGNTRARELTEITAWNKGRLAQAKPELTTQILTALLRRVSCTAQVNTGILRGLVVAPCNNGRKHLSTVPGCHQASHSRQK
jgi:hypothetical protein